MSALYAMFNSPGGAEQAAQELLQAGASSTDLRLVCWSTGGMVSLVLPTGGLDRGHSEQILLRHFPIRLGDRFEARAQAGTLSHYGDDFQADAKIRFQGTRWANSFYQDFQPVYEYGSELAHDMHLRDCDWSEVEGEARQNWPAHFPFGWEEVQGAAQYAYERVRAGMVGPL